MLSRGSFKIKRYNKPLFISPVNILFAYYFPSLSEFRNISAVGPIMVTQTNFGLQYFAFPKHTNSSSDDMPRPSKLCIIYP
ncbi:MAG TPA: hypothetical protein VFM31_00370 [Nitrososphaeraceae archaeon]|nr:hypothetical protein [Nitrososphaeraceae archaeon]